MDRYKVEVSTYGGELLVREFQQDGKSAAAFAESLEADGGVLDGLPLDGVTVAVWELCNGDWTLESKRLVRMR